MANLEIQINEPNRKRERRVEFIEEEEGDDKNK